MSRSLRCVAPPRSRILVLTRDPTTSRLGGNAIRAVGLSRVLATRADVTLASPGGDPGVDGVAHVEWAPARPRTIAAAVGAADTILSAPQDPATHALLRRSGARLVFDLYDPFPLEVLEAYADAPAFQRRLHETITSDSFVEAMRMGHHFLCASERQRDLWLGAMLALGLLRAETYRADPTLRSRIDVVPLGLVEQPPRPGPGPRERFADAIGPGDEVVVWMGGLWNWVDPLTAVRAMALLSERRQQARLVVVAGPPPDGADGRMARATHDLAGELGLTGGSVLFAERVPYAERGAWLLQANCAISLHVDNVETRFAFRTRLVDYIWANAPIVCTGGDELGGLVERERLGVVTPPGDPDAVATALDAVLERGRGDYAADLERVARDLTWTKVSEPLHRMMELAVPPRMGAAPLAPARPGPPVRALLTRALRCAQRAVIR
jgi:glycosyltransferase involved in cell wall biosynthesis